MPGQAPAPRRGITDLVADWMKRQFLPPPEVQQTAQIVRERIGQERERQQLPGVFNALPQLQALVANWLTQSAVDTTTPGGAALSVTDIGPVAKAASVPALALASVLAKRAPKAVSGAVQKGIRAFHGSPHDFDRFDLSKIGTGEGAQAYGHGLYFADKEATAKAYRDQLAGRIPLGAAGPSDSAHVAAAQDFLTRGASPDAALVGLKQAYPGASDDELRLAIHAANPGRMYEVNINADPDTLLDWDKPLGQQSPQVREALARDWLAHPEDHARQTGRQIYDATAMGQRDVAIGRGRNQDTTLPAVQAAASRALRESGIPGIKYLDQGSRSAGEGTRNYVIFDDSIIDILRKYGLLMGAGTAAAASQAQRPQPTMMGRQ